MLYQLSYTRPIEDRRRKDERRTNCFIPYPSAFILIHWCRGQDSNLRRMLIRRVYSPVPLTARPPLHTPLEATGAGEGT